MSNIIRCPHRPALSAIEADPDSAIWSNIAPAGFFDAVTAAPPKQRTWVRTFWTDAEWRILFQCEDSDPWATLTERDAKLFTEETVEVFFDPFGDLESYYEIEVNPLGAELDIVFRRSRSGYKGDWAWDCEGLRTRSRIVPGGWIVEMVIPFASVAAVPGPGVKWRANFCRIDRPSRDGSLPRELSAWVPPMRENFHTPERFGVVEFIRE